jgi:uncharacterized protein (UPF0335 family)
MSAWPSNEPAASESAAIAGRELLSFIERAERMNAEVERIAEDKVELFKEVKFRGYSAKTIKDIIKHRAQDPSERAEAEAMFDLYMKALGECL